MKQILHIEDESLFRENIAFLLEEEGFKTISVDSAEKALEVLSKNIPDLVLCDVLMPGMSGFELLEHVRKLFDIMNKPIPFIFLSGLDNNDDILHGTALEADDYITKTVSFPILVAKIRNILSKYERLYQSNLHLQATDQTSSPSNEINQLEYLDDALISELALQKELTCIRQVMERVTGQIKRNKHRQMSSIFLDIPSYISKVNIDRKYFSHALILLLEKLLEKISSITLKVDQPNDHYIELVIQKPSGISLEDVINDNKKSLFIENILTLHAIQLSPSDDCIKIRIPAYKPH